MSKLNERYIIKQGRFGSYFYDIELMKDVDLHETKGKLNAYDNLRKKQDKLFSEFWEKIESMRLKFANDDNYTVMSLMNELWDYQRKIKEECDIERKKESS